MPEYNTQEADEQGKNHTQRQGRHCRNSCLDRFFRSAAEAYANGCRHTYGQRIMNTSDP